MLLPHILFMNIFLYAQNEQIDLPRRRSDRRGDPLSPQSRPSEPEMPLASLPSVLIEPIVRAALLEDLGRAGDITTDAIVPSDVCAKVSLAARQAGVVAGLDLALMAFRLIDPAIVASYQKPKSLTLAGGFPIAADCDSIRQRRFAARRIRWARHSRSHGRSIRLRHCASSQQRAAMALRFGACWPSP
jgi:hypothetical protein